MTLPYRLARPLLFWLEPERAHRLAVHALAAGVHPRGPAPDPRLRQTLLGLDFPSPVGMAAGFDKNAEVPDAVLALGFGFAEVGTVTPRPQVGNPRPRIFRLPREHAIINRLAFNNEGHDAIHRRLARRAGRSGVVGVNIGANRDSTDKIADYVSGVDRFADVARYFTINVSSPNTPGLRDLQEKEALTDLLRRVIATRDSVAARPVPLLLKISPDLDDNALAVTVDTAIGSGIDGIIVSNTTVARDGVADRQFAAEAGGLSGRPLFHRSTVMLAKVRKRVGPELVLVGVGGIDSTETAFAKIAAGANLVQLYTGFVYEGPDLAGDIVKGLPRLLDRHGFATIGEATASAVDRVLSEFPA